MASAAGNEGQAEAAEGAVARRLPHVQLGPDERERHRQSVAADALRQADDVRFDPDVLETEEGRDAAATHLDVVDDEDAVAPADGGELPQPREAGDVDPALPLHGLHDDGGHAGETALGDRQQGLDVRDAGPVVDVAAPTLAGARSWRVASEGDEARWISPGAQGMDRPAPMSCPRSSAFAGDLVMSLALAVTQVVQVPATAGPQVSGMWATTTAAASWAV